MATMNEIFSPEILENDVAMTCVKQALLRHMLFVGADGKPLTIDGDYGFNTEYATNAFQNALRQGAGIETGTNGDNDGDFGELCLTSVL